MVNKKNHMVKKKNHRLNMTHLWTMQAPPPPSTVPAGLSPENIPEVSTLDTHLDNSNLNSLVGYVLPFRTNRGKPPKRYSPDDAERRSKYPIANYMSTKRLSEPLRGFVHVLSSIQVPAGIQEALSNPKWTQAIKEEIEALLKNDTWTLVPLPEGKKAVGCKWVFSIKHRWISRKIQSKIGSKRLYTNI
jgi:hypothetical protein